MGRTPVIPIALRRGAFTLADASRHGLDKWNLRGSSWRRLGPEPYALARLGDAPMVRLEATKWRLPAGAVFSGLTAAWLNGLDVEPCDPIEVTVPAPARLSTRAGMLVRRQSLPKEGVVRAGGQPATSMVRTIRDLCPRLSLTEAVVIIDAALHARKLKTKDLAVMATSAAPGVRALRKALEHVEPAVESRMETRLRMLLVLAGLPRPEAQVVIRDPCCRCRRR